jgi:hypothetical protein
MSGRLKLRSLKAATDVFDASTSRGEMARALTMLQSKEVSFNAPIDIFLDLHRLR